MTVQVLSVLLCAAMLFVGADSMGCVDNSGRFVDYFFVYKMPNGFRYAYRDSTGQNASQLAAFPGFLNTTTDNAVGSTLHQIYLNKQSYSYVLYNDESPLSTNPVLNRMRVLDTSVAHAKGVLAHDPSTGGGFWLIHSVPKFPDLRGPDFKWSASTIYGQTFLCLSLDSTNINTAAQQLQALWPGIYESNLASGDSSNIPAFASLLNGSRTNSPSTQEITTEKGQTFTHFAKDYKWGQDIYEDLVSPYYKQSMMWETWRRSPFLPSYCPSGGFQYDSLNVEYMNMGSGDNDNWHYTQDHAKWGLSTSDVNPIVCIGDINRMQSQRERGGGTCCASLGWLHSALKSSIAQADSC